MKLKMESINIFIPETIFCKASGFLSGKYLPGNFECEQDTITIIIDEKVQEMAQSESIGEILPINRYITRTKKKPTWIILSTEPSFHISRVTIHGRIIDVGNINVVFYNPFDIKESYLITKTESCYNCSSKKMECFVNRVKMIKKKTKKIDFKESKILKLVLQIYFFIISYGKFYLNNINIFFSKKFDARSYSLHQIIHRLKLVEKVWATEDFVTNRILGILLFDSFVGFLSFYLLFNWTSAPELNLWFQSSTKIVASNVQELLEWLSGAPAGLKLNQPLTESLSAFFSYHVYLWTLYLEVASPVLGLVAHAFIFVGLLGISIQIALLADFLSMAVLHIHCFYIYAARIHMLQMSLLGSHWRGFRGRKWNPLKERVDTRSERRQKPIHKVISTMGFTFVVFLFPTTTVYYTVFVVLRLCLMSVQGFFSLLLWALNSNPIYIFWLYIIKSPIIKGKYHFEMESEQIQDTDLIKDTSPVKLRLIVRTSPFCEAISASHSDDVFFPIPTPNIKRILHSLIYAKQLL